MRRSEVRARRQAPLDLGIDNAGNLYGVASGRTDGIVFEYTP
jgi:hypothetical protein